jgi:hypothetical protein
LPRVNPTEFVEKDTSYCQLKEDICENLKLSQIWSYDSLAGMDLGQKASATIGFIKNPNITIKKASIPLKIYLKSLKILEKASISLKDSSKII